MLSSLVALFPVLLSLSPTPHAGSSPPPPRPTASVTTCSAVTKPQIEAAVGHHLDAAPEEHGKFASTCNYSAGDVAVTISIRHLIQPLDLTAEIENLRAALPGSVLHEVQGMGSRAFALDIPGAGTQLHILPDEHAYLLVSVLGVAHNRSADAAATIARSALRHFQCCHF